MDKTRAEVAVDEVFEMLTNYTEGSSVRPVSFEAFKRAVDQLIYECAGPEIAGSPRARRELQRYVLAKTDLTE